MKLECTLDDLNVYMQKMFTPDAIKTVRLSVDIQMPTQKTLTTLFKTYPPSLPMEHRPAFDAAIEVIDAEGKINAIKQVREVTGWTLKEGKDFIEQWFPQAPMTKAGRS